MPSHATCPYCRGIGTNHAVYGPVPCPDCAGQGNVYACLVCGQEYAGYYEAQACEDAHETRLIDAELERELATVEA